MGRTRLLITQVRRTGVPELSAVVIAQGRIYVADDELGVAELGTGGARFGANGALGPDDLDDHVILALPASLEEALEDVGDVAPGAEFPQCPVNS